MAGKLSEMPLEQLWEIFPVILREHVPRWKDWYGQEENLIAGCLDKSEISRISHIGSTSVPGLLAKPTVDILLEIAGDCDPEKLAGRLEGHGYILERIPGNPAPHMMLMKGYTAEGFAERVFHLHVRYPGDWDELYFRDYLGQHSDAAQGYARLKMRLQARYRHDRDGYTDAKTEFIRSHTALARKEFPGRYIPSGTGRG